MEILTLAGGRGFNMLNDCAVPDWSVLICPQLAGLALLGHLRLEVIEEQF